MLNEAKRLYDLGFGVHWLKPKSKVPVKAGWGSGPRDDWPTLERSYRPGYGLGVRMGEASRLPSGDYVANIDVDIKSSDPRHQKEALDFLESLYPGLYKAAPIVKTGYGLRLFVTTEAPASSVKLGRSKDECIVKMPSTDISTMQRAAARDGKITDAQLDDGYRLRPAWEVEFMSQGRQVVVPPSTHPETGKPYTWQRPIGMKPIPRVRATCDTQPTRKNQAVESKDFNAVPVDLVTSDLPDKIIGMIESGEGVDDRSSAIYAVCIAMVKAKFSDDEILSVLTDKKNFLGEVAYEHAKTKSRERAARWVKHFGLEKARRETSPQNAFEAVDDFSDLIGGATTLSEEDAKKQQAELTGDGDWRRKIKREKPPKNAPEDHVPPPCKTVENTVLILKNAIGQRIFTRDLFALRDAYGCDAPWPGGEAGKAVTDDDTAHIILWLGRNFRFEPPDHVVDKAITAIATDNGFHPVKTELEALEAWDGTARLDTWLAEHFQAKGDHEYLAQVFRKWIVASVTRVYDPGAKVDWMPIFQGNQGTGKSSFGAILFGENYTSDWLPRDLSDKDAALGLQGIRCHEFCELESLRKNELDTTKAFITRRSDKVRPPYGRKWLESPRQCVFFGTTNRDTYLKDDTGNRRFMPVEVGHLDFETLRSERDQLWAEALFIYKNGLERTLYLESQAAKVAVQKQHEKLIEDESTFMVNALIKHYKSQLKKPTEDRFDFSRFKLVELFDEMAPLAKWRQTMANLKFAAKAMLEIGGEKFVIDGRHRWRWEPK